MVKDMFRHGDFHLTEFWDFHRYLHGPRSLVRLGHLGVSRQLLSARIQTLGVAEYWLMGAGTAVMLFASVLLQRTGHSVVAKRYGIAVPRITLFIFGGVSEIATEPRSPGVEFWIATSGPIVTFKT